jgi:putative sterol carrier protein
MRFGPRVLRAFVRRSDDRRIERTLGSRAALPVLFAAMARRFVPTAAAGFAGEIGYALSRAGGATESWTVTVAGGAARARRGAPAEPALVVRMSCADFVRLAAGEVDAGAALLDGRIDLEGDFALATRLGAMFGRPGA